MLLLTALFVIYRPQRAFPHYLLFSIIPISCCIASVIGACSELNWWKGSARVVPFVFAGLFVVPCLTVAMAMPNRFVAEMISNLTDRIDAAAMGIARYAKPGDTIAVWGWASEFYVQTGTIMAARDADTTHMTYAHPNRDYRRGRYMSDLERSKPSVFVDAVGPYTFGLHDRSTEAHESFPALYAYIRSNYELKEHVDGIRIYVRTGDSGATQAGSFLFQAGALPNMATFDNASDQPVTFQFSAAGSWSWAAGGTQMGPAGSDTPAPGTFYLPGARSFGLIAKRGDGSFEYIGEKAELTLKPHEVISFLMNDMAGTSADNPGSMKISWVRK
jgi:hypothetical protein